MKIKNYFKSVDEEVKNSECASESKNFKKREFVFIQIQFGK
jgi:hypothetical protein